MTSKTSPKATHCKSRSLTLFVIYGKKLFTPAPGARTAATGRMTMTNSVRGAKNLYHPSNFLFSQVTLTCSCRSC